MKGPGKYDDACTIVREATGAAVCVVIVLGGRHGDGFSCQAEGYDPTPYLPNILRTVANGIEYNEPPNQNQQADGSATVAEPTTDPDRTSNPPSQ